MLQPEDDRHFLRKFNRFFRQAVNDYGLISRQSTVVLGLSGGIDSLVLLDQLADDTFRRQKNISVVAAHVLMPHMGYNADLSYLRSLCDARNVPFVVRETAFNLETDHRKSPCFLCSWHRRKVLFDIAKEHGSCHIALGHHLDDMLETLLMNMTFQGSFSTMPPLLKMEKFDMNIIRPLSLLSKEEIQRYAVLKSFRPLEKTCPYEKGSFRSDIHHIIEQLVALNPKARTSMLAAMENIKEEYLPKKCTSGRK